MRTPSSESVLPRRRWLFGLLLLPVAAFVLAVAAPEGGAPPLTQADVETLVPLGATKAEVDAVLGDPGLELFMPAMPLIVRRPDAGKPPRPPGTTFAYERPFGHRRGGHQYVVVKFDPEWKVTERTAGDPDPAEGQPLLERLRQVLRKGYNFWWP